MWADNETTEDFLNYKVHANLIKEYVTNPNLLPLTIGVFGDWGSGKSSIMKILEQKLKDNNKVLTIYFNSWLFESYEDAKVSLLENILLELSKNKTLDEKAKKKLLSLISKVDYMKLAKDSIKKYGKNVVDIIATGGIGTAIEAGFSMLNVDKLKELSTADVSKLDKYIKEEQDNATKNTIKTFRNDFEKLIDSTNYDSIVIFVDDLDRCMPERVIDTLEAIKLFLSVKNTAFVIGADERIIKHSISMHLKLHTFNNNSKYLQDLEQIVTDYIEKLIQIPYRIPKLSPSEIESYNNLLFSNSFLNKDDFEKIYEDYLAFRRNDFYSAYSFGHIEKIINLESLELGKLLHLSHVMSKMITNTLKGNPRQTKRFLNTFVLRSKLAKVANLLIDDLILIKLMLLEYPKIELYEKLNESQSQNMGISKDIQLLESKYLDDNEDLESELKHLTEWHLQEIINWIKTEPRIGDKDLRNYFWLSRDKTASTMSDVHRTDPFIQKLYYDLIDGDKHLLQITLNEVKNLQLEQMGEILKLLKRDLLNNPSKIEICINCFYEICDIKKEDYLYEEFINIIAKINLSLIKDYITLATKLHSIYKQKTGLQEKCRNLLISFSEKTGKLSIRAKQILEKI